MALANDTASMALFCDFENIALGVRDAQYEKFDIRPVLERLLAKGSIVVKKAYCDWERYKGFKAAMHEANFELIEIPHVRQSGKNSADIRMVVDALDLCYTKAHVDTFVIISGDSDFSPLVSKLRENAKKVIGVGVKQSCSDLLVTNCDEFIYYDDLVRDREAQRNGNRRERDKRSPEDEAKRREKVEERKTRAVELAASTLADMMADRGDSERIWASVLKEVLKRRNPGFNESYFGFRSFGNLLEEAAARGLITVGRDDKSGTYVMRAPARPVDAEAAGEAPVAGAEAPLAEPVADAEAASETPAANVSEEKPARRRGNRRQRGEKTEKSGEEPAAGGEASAEASTGAVAPVQAEAAPPALQAAAEAGEPTAAPEAAPESPAAPAKGTRAKRPAKKRSSAKAAAPADESAAGEPMVSEAVAPVAAAEGVVAAALPEAAAAAPEDAKARKPARRSTRTPRSRKPKTEA